MVYHKGKNLTEKAQLIRKNGERNYGYWELRDFESDDPAEEYEKKPKEKETLKEKHMGLETQSQYRAKSGYSTLGISTNKCFFNHIYVQWWPKLWTLF
ncbi:hypothetical protein TNCV_3199421 [Trichonephila clavipes]|nr:hypothetical protein TNCV_3199421 [Trichonephila clavipes]